MSNRKLNAAFAQLIQQRNTTVSLEADGETDPTKTNAPDTTADDTVVDQTTPDATATDTVDDITDTPVDPVVDPTVAVTDPAVDPITDTVANASAGEAEVGQAAEPTKIVIDVNVNQTPSEPVETVMPATVLDPANAVLASSVPPGAMVVVVPNAAVTEDVLINQDNDVEVVDPDSAVVTTDPVAAVDGGYVESNILSEEELKTIEFYGDGAKEELEVVNAMDVKIVELEGEISQYEAGHQSMKKMTEVLDTSKEEGGITDNAAHILKIAVEHITEQLGMHESVMLGIPSLESFALPASRQSATSLALEDLKETVAKVWAAIQAGYQKVMEWLGTFFKHLLDANAKLASRATAIQAAATKLTAPTSVEKFDNPGIAKALANGQRISPNIAQQLAALNKFATSCQNNAPGLYQQLVPLVKKMESSATAETTNQDALTEIDNQISEVSSKFVQALAADSGLSKDGRNPATFGLAAPAQTQDLYTSNTWLGNKVVFAYVPNSGGSGYRAGQATADVGDIDGSCPVLAPKDITAIAGLVLEYTKTAQAGQTVWAGMQELSKTVMAGAQIVNSNAVVTGAQGYEKFKIFAATMKDVRAMCSGIQQPAMAIAAAANAQALEYAARSLKMLGAKLPAPAAVPAGAAPATESITDDLSMEGVIDDLKHPIEALKRKFSTSDEAVFARELEAKRKVLRQERDNLSKVQKAVSASKENDSHAISLKKVQGKFNFSASTPAQLVAGIAKNVKFIEATAASVAKVKSKAEAEAIQTKFKAEMEKTGSVPETMTFNKAQVEAYLTECHRAIDAMEKYLNALETLSKVYLSSEAFGDLGITVLKVIGSIVAGLFFSFATGPFINILVLGAIMVNPFLGLAVGLVLGGLQLVGIVKVVKHTYKEIGKKLDKKDDSEPSSSMTPAMA